MYKVLSKFNFINAHLTGKIQNEKSDINSPFIHACTRKQIPLIVTKYYNYVDYRIVVLDPLQITKEGFEIRFEANKLNGDKYYHLYRKNPTHLLTVKSIMNELN